MHGRGTPPAPPDSIDDPAQVVAVTTWDTKIPPGREDLYRRQAEADAKVERAEAAWKAADQRAERTARHRTAYDPQVKAADAEAGRLLLELDRAAAIADRVYQERTAGLSGWIDCSPHLPVCTACDGTGGPPGSDAHTSCRTCLGWGREDDGRPSIPEWHEADDKYPAGWVDPATGRDVDVLADSPPQPERTPMDDPTTANSKRRTVAPCTRSRDCMQNDGHSGGCSKTPRGRWQTFRAWTKWVYPSDRIGSPPPAPRPLRRKTKAQLITARVDAALLAQKSSSAGEAGSAPPQLSVVRSPEPQDLDVLDMPSCVTPFTVVTPGSPLASEPATGAGTSAATTSRLDIDLGPEWCNCGWMAGAHRHDLTPELNVGGLLPPPPAHDPTREPTDPRSTSGLDIGGFLPPSPA